MPKCFASALAAAAASNCHAGSARVGTLPLRERGGRAVGDEQLGDVQALEHAPLASAAGTSVSVNCARREIEPRDARPVPARIHGDEQAVALGVEQVGIGHRARRDDAQHLALHRPLARRRVADLLADRDGLAQLHELREVAIDGVVGHAGHRDRRAGRLSARGQRDVEQPRGALRVVVEKLVEIAHPVEEQLVRMLRLGAEVLLHHRRMARRCGSGGMDGGAHSPIIRVRHSRLAHWRGSARLRHNALAPIRNADAASRARARPPRARRSAPPLVGAVRDRDRSRREAGGRCGGARRRARDRVRQDRLRRQHGLRPARAHAHRRRASRRAAARARAVASAPAPARCSTTPSCGSSSRSRRPRSRAATRACAGR